MGIKPKRWLTVVPALSWLLVGFIVLVAGLLLMPMFNSAMIYVLHYELDHFAPLTNDTPVIFPWEDPMENMDLYMKLYFLDIQNPDDILKGAKPFVVEKGPYTYKMIRYKMNVVFDKKDNYAMYAQNQGYLFNSTLSAGTMFDYFTTVNIPLLAMLQMMHASPDAEKLLNETLKRGILRNQTIFKNITINQVIWGYEDKLVDDVKNMAASLNVTLPIPNNGYYGFFFEKNLASDGVYKIDAGWHGLSTYMDVITWKNQTSLPYWKSKYCNMMNGTDGSVYHPYVNKTETLYMFSSDIGRSFGLNYDSNPTYKGVPTYRFKPTPSIFAYPPDNMDGACFCLGDNGCPGNGVMNISIVEYSAPVFVSQPHFLNGPHYSSAIDGIEPNDTLHNMHIDLDPMTGFVIQNVKRLQMNMPVNRNPYAGNMSKVTEGMYPIFWLEQSAIMSDHGIDCFKTISIYTRQKVQKASYFLICIGGGIMVLTLLVTAFMKVVQPFSKKSEISVDQSERAPLLGGSTSPPKATNNSGKGFNY